MKFSVAIDRYVADMCSAGRFSLKATERSYRAALNSHREDISNRDPAYVGRTDVKTTLRRWPNPNTQRTRRASLVSFYDWTMGEGLRKDNPARQTHSPRKRPTAVYRLTRAEAAAMMLATKTRRERWAIYLGICCGLRNAELRGLQGKHLARPGFIWVSADIAKGGRERWVPVIPDLELVVAEIRAAVTDDEYVLPAQRFRDPPFNRIQGDVSLRPSSSQALRTLVMDIGHRAGIQAHVHPHLMRHAYADHIGRHAGIRNAQFLLGHAGIATTEMYLGKPSLEDLSTAVEGFSYGEQTRTNVLGGSQSADTADKATMRIELMYTALQAAA